MKEELINHLIKLRKLPIYHDDYVSDGFIIERYGYKEALEFLKVEREKVSK